MSDAKRDANRVTAALGVSSVDSVTTLPVLIDPVTGRVLVDSGAASGGGTSMVDDSAFTPGTTSGTPAFGFFDDTAPDSVDEGDAGALRMSGNRNLYIQIRDAAGNERGLAIDANNRAGVVPVGSVAHDAVGTGVNPLLIGGYAATSAPTAVAVGDAVRAWYGLNGQAAIAASPVSLTSADGVSNVVNGFADVQSNTIRFISRLELYNGSTWDRVRGDTNGIYVNGNVANDAVDAGNPVKIGGRASGAPITAVAANDRVDAFFDLQGRQVVAQKASTGTQTTVAGSASNVTLIAANTARLGATIYNDSTAILYVRLAATATTSNFSVKMLPDDYYEIPSGYTGIVDGIWASATGNARLTEIT